MLSKNERDANAKLGIENFKRKYKQFIELFYEEYMQAISLGYHEEFMNNLLYKQTKPLEYFTWAFYNELDAELREEDREGGNQYHEATKRFYHKVVKENYVPDSEPDTENVIQLFSSGTKE